MSTDRKPDFVLALFVAEVCLGSTIPLGYLDSGAYGFVPAALLVIVYVLYESVRSAWPLTGMLVGAFGFLLIVIGNAAGAMRQSVSESLPFAYVVGVGSAVGLLASTVAWLIRRKRVVRPTSSSAVPRERPRGWLLLPVAVLALAPFLESLLMTLQMDVNRSIQRLLWIGGDIVSRRLLAFDRPVVVVLSVLAGYALLRYRRWARPMITAYLGVGLALALARMLVGVHLDSQVVMSVPANSGYVYANVGVPYLPIALSDYIRACGLEVAARAIACAVGIPWLFLSPDLKRYLGLGKVDQRE
jgi:hypothetical protein